MARVLEGLRAFQSKLLGKRAATALLRRVQFHYTPKHASWLNMAETERVNDFETEGGLNSGSDPTAAESRRGCGKRFAFAHSPLENPAGFPHLTAAGVDHHATFSFSSSLGRLIQAGPGSAGGFGRPLGKRSGWAWNA